MPTAGDESATAAAGSRPVWPAPGRHNKLYRCPPTPSDEERLVKEKSFVLDNNAVSSISIDYSKANPKLGPAIPPYNGQKDGHTRRYFQFYGVDRTLAFYNQMEVAAKSSPVNVNVIDVSNQGEDIVEFPLVRPTAQKRSAPSPRPEASDYGGASIDGPVVDRFHQLGAGYQYLSLRNQHGAGHSRQDVDGHAQFMQGIKPIVGYNGLFGYRRNTPWLRTSPSTFGVVSRSATH